MNIHFSMEKEVNMLYKLQEPEKRIYKELIDTVINTSKLAKKEEKKLIKFNKEWEIITQEIIKKRKENGQICIEVLKKRMEINEKNKQDIEVMRQKFQENNKEIKKKTQESNKIQKKSETSKIMEKIFNIHKENQKRMDFVIEAKNESKSEKLQQKLEKKYHKKKEIELSINNRIDQIINIDNNYCISDEISKKAFKLFEKINKNINNNSQEKDIHHNTIKLIDECIKKIKILMMFLTQKAQEDLKKHEKFQKEYAILKKEYSILQKNYKQDYKQNQLFLCSEQRMDFFFKNFHKDIENKKIFWTQINTIIQNNKLLIKINQE